MPACAFAHHSTAANAAARRAARSPLATHRAPLYCAARRSRRRPRPALPPQLDWPDPWAETNWVQTESKCGDSVSTAQRNQGCEMRFAGCELATRPNSMQVRKTVCTLDAPRSTPGVGTAFFWHTWLAWHAWHAFSNERLHERKQENAPSRRQTQQGRPEKPLERIARHPGRAARRP